MFLKTLLFFIKIELKNFHVILSIILFCTASVFLAYHLNLNTQQPENSTLVFWLITLFATVFSSINSFQRELNENHLYLYTLLPPKKILFAKMMVAIISNSVFSFATFLLINLFLGNFPGNLLYWLISILIAVSTFSLLLTLTSALASRTPNPYFLSLILGLPLLIPAVIVISRLNQSLILSDSDAFVVSSFLKYLFFLLSLDVLILVFSFILFPMFWKD